jgi:amphi-Trp domain-containing protein
MPEEQLFKTEERRTRADIADALVATAEEIEAGTVQLESGADQQTVEVPEEATFEVELERVTDSETGETYFELEYELSWSQ